MNVRFLALRFHLEGVLELINGEKIRFIGTNGRALIKVNRENDLGIVT